MKVEWGQNLRHLLWAESILQVRFNAKDCVWLASLNRKGELLGVVVYDHFTTTNCEMSVAAASPKFLSRRALRAFFGYPFGQMNLCRVTAVVSTDNTHSYQFCRRAGFVVEGCLKKWFGATDGIIMGLLKEDCKWL